MCQENSSLYNSRHDASASASLSRVRGTGCAFTRYYELLLCVFLHPNVKMSQFLAYHEAMGRGYVHSITASPKAQPVATQVTTTGRLSPLLLWNKHRCNKPSCASQIRISRASRTEDTSMIRASRAEIFRSPYMPSRITRGKPYTIQKYLNVHSGLPCQSPGQINSRSTKTVRGFTLLFIRHCQCFQTSSPAQRFVRSHPQKSSQARSLCYNANASLLPPQMAILSAAAPPRRSTS